MATRQGFFFGAVLAALLVAATSFAAVAEAPVGPDPVVEKWPQWPYKTSCGDLEFDPVAVFGGPTGAERGSRPSEKALSAFLKRERWVSDYLPTRHWRLLAETGDAAEFASGRLSYGNGPTTVSLERKAGRWKLWGLSDGCEPTSIVDGFHAVTWTLPLDKPRPQSIDRHLWINLGPGPCNGGRSQNAMAREPVIWRIDRKLMMAMTLEPLPPGGYTCQGLIEPPLKVTLPEPVGNYRLFDGATYPPRDALKTWTRERAARSRAARR
jgi:hypothetical protein